MTDPKCRVLCVDDHRDTSEMLQMLLSEEDYRSLEETAYLSRSPRNLKRLLEALNRKEGKSLDEVRKELGI